MYHALDRLQDEIIDAIECARDDGLSLKECEAVLECHLLNCQEAMKMTATNRARVN